MPTYDYECSNCNYRFDTFQSMSEDPLTECPECKEDTLKRLIGGGAGIIFKGSGFYVTDSKGKKSGKSTASSNGETSGESSKSGDSAPSKSDGGSDGGSGTSESSSSANGGSSGGAGSESSQSKSKVSNKSD